MDLKNNNEKELSYIEEVFAVFKDSVYLVTPFTKIFPAVIEPLKNVNIQEKLVWTILTVAAYGAASQVPLYGIINTGFEESTGWLKIMLSANRGTLMDIGIAPVITGSTIMNFLHTAGIVVPDNSLAEEKILGNVFQKVVVFLITSLTALFNICQGYYGPVDKIPLGSKIMIFAQLEIAGLFIQGLDEILSKGYGYGNGVNLFIVSSACQKLVWNSLSPRAHHTARGLEFEGCIVSLIYSLIKRPNKLSALMEVCFRTNLPNLMDFTLTLLVFAAVVYIFQLTVELPIFSTNSKGYTQSYPIPLIYTSTTPVIIQSQIFTNICAVSRILFSFFPHFRLVRLLGVWGSTYNKVSAPLSGLSYYLTSPESFRDILEHPFQFLSYLFFTLGTAAFLSKNWADNHSDSAASVYQRFQDQGIRIKGVRESNTLAVLKNHIDVASVLSGVVISSIMVFCDVSNAYGSGSNVILAVSIIYKYFVSSPEYSQGKYGKLTAVTTSE